MPRTVLMTGFPGFISIHLARRVLTEPDTRIAFLVLPSQLEAAEQQRLALPNAHRTEIVPGDITNPKLGWSEEEYTRRAAMTTTVYHLAALYDMAAPEDASYRINVQGTEHILDFCAAAENLERLIYFSTAYVSGKTTGTVSEDDLYQAIAWKNHYERTKWEAEVAVRSRWDKIPTVIIRPGVVVGDSQTGEINKYDGPYYVIRALLKLESAGLKWLGKWFLTKEKGNRFYLVPVDYLTDAVEYLARAERETTVGKAYHVLPESAMTYDEVIEAILAEFGLFPPLIRFPAWVGRNLWRTFPFVANYFAIPIEVFSYSGHTVTYSTTNLNRALAGSDLACPSPRTYVKTMVQFVRRHPEIPPNYGIDSTTRRDTTSASAAISPVTVSSH